MKKEGTEPTNNIRKHKKINTETNVKLKKNREVKCIMIKI